MMIYWCEWIIPHFYINSFGFCVSFDVMYQTRETVFHSWVIQTLRRDESNK